MNHGPMSGGIDYTQCPEQQEVQSIEQDGPVELPELFLLGLTLDLDSHSHQKENQECHKGHQYTYEYIKSHLQPYSNRTQL